MASTDVIVLGSKPLGVWNKKSEWDKIKGSP
jgi:hypothetical protein